MHKLVRSLCRVLRAGAPGCLLLVLFTQISVARVHTAIGGYFNQPSTWSDGIVPSCAGGETVVVASGATLIQNISCTLGSKTQAVGPAMHLLANSNYYPVFNTVLTLRGFDSSNNVLALIDLGGQFVPQPGVTIVSDCATDGACVFVNNGYLRSANVKWTIPSGNLSWNNSTTYFVTTLGYLDQYNLPNVLVARLAQPWISNSEGTGPGSATDSSMSFQDAPAGTLHTEVATLAQVNSPGTYYVNYDAGVLYWYQASGEDEPQPLQAFYASYKYLTYIGGVIVSTNNVAGNQAIFDHSTFTFMGTIAADNTYLITAAYKKSNSAGPNQLLQVTNNTFRYCKRLVGFTGPVNGTANDPILLSGNSIYTTLGDSWGSAFAVAFVSSSYVSVQNNVVPGNLWGAPFLNVNANDAVITMQGWTIQNNVVRSSAFEQDAPGAVLWPDSVIANNFIMGFSGAFDGRQIAGFGGTSGHPTLIKNNVFVHPHRVMNVASYQQFANNYIADFDHHGVNGPALYNDTQVTNVTLTGNIFTDGGDWSSFQLGYVTKVWIDNLIIAQNTSIHPTQGGIEFGDQGDNEGTALLSNLNIYNNLFPFSAYGAIRRPDTPSGNTRVHLYRADWSDFYGDTTTYLGINSFSTFTWNGGDYDTSSTRNVTGVSLGDCSYNAPQSGFSLNWTVTNPSNVTLSWSGGAPVQMVAYSRQVTAAANNSNYGIPGLYSGTLTDSTQNFPTALNAPTVPAGMWVKIVGGTGAGEVRRVTSNTPQVLTVVPAWSTVPDTSSAYVLFKSEVKLFDAAGGNYVLAALDLRSVPAGSATDSGIGLVFHTVNTNPLFVNRNASWRTWDVGQGGDGSEDATFTLLSSNPALISNLLSYVRLQFAPKNIVLTHGFNNQYIGAVPPGGGIGP